VAAVDAHPGVTIRVTAAPAELPPDLGAHPRIVALGRLSWARLRSTWAQSRAVYFPTGLEAFGYPLAEARLSGHPVIARDTAQGRELAGPALCGYTQGDARSLREAVARALTTTVAPDPTRSTRRPTSTSCSGRQADRTALSAKALGRECRSRKSGF
jgi:glycosyltransferase involved in cell wall biosynthesis